MKTFFQALSLFVFSLLFLVFANYRLPEWLPADIYLRLDPLLGLSAVLAGREFIGRALWSLILIGATLVIGRFFCAYVCPMGAAIDFLDPLFWRRKDRSGLKNNLNWRKVKYYLFILFLSSSIAGLTLAYLLDPLPFLTRFFTFFLYPMVITLLDLFLDLFRPIFRFLGWMDLSYQHYTQPVYYMALLTFVIFSAVIALNRIVPRFWCRYLCPLGAFLSLMSPLGLFKRQVSPECNECLKCVRTCPMGAIEQDPKSTRLPECIQCRTCAQVCPQEAIAFPALPSSLRVHQLGGEYSSVDFSRRGFLYSFTGGLAAAFLVDRTPFTPTLGKQQIIRPPGALPESEFLRTCIRCGECMKSCVTNTLQPSFWESGLSGLWTPGMDLRFAACEQSCNVCGKVCPTQAIRSLSLEEKTHAKVGTAILHKERCLVWAQDKLCLICDEICPYNAIVFRTVDGYRRPVVIASKCNGCGFCEQRCPVGGTSAIVVVPDGEIRLKEGSYIKEAQRLQLEFKPDAGDDKFILESSGFKVEGKEAPERTANPASPQQKPPMRKPAGFM
ncbi:MAG TPA: 4Fe-4S dicluster domain-containing protein [Thermodesulfobacteriota bacterium]|nr:4Fe-4S dicluster domain-containing protein [Thermodesulfobacteriota bacterium]